MLNIVSSLRQKPEYPKNIWETFSTSLATKVMQVKSKSDRQKLKYLAIPNMEEDVKKKN